jgi:hypothetical protein
MFYASCKSKISERTWRIGQNMSQYVVAGGTFTNLEGQEQFDLMSPGPGEPPYILVEEDMGYFRLVFRQNAHLYRVEDDYSLSLVVLSHEALQWGIKAPEKIKLDKEIVKKLQAVIELS